MVTVVMPISCQDPAAGQFPASTRAAMAREIEALGVTADPWVARAADLPAFGLNLACAWPFPDAVLQAYTRFAEGLARVPGLCVYPPAQTHITLVTLLSFHLHFSPTQEERTRLESIGHRALELIRRRWPELGAVGPFVLQAEMPVLTRKACLIPWRNPSGEVASIRHALAAWLESDRELMSELRLHGFNVPGIIHSTVGRFAEGAGKPQAVTAAFAAAVADLDLPALRVEEILVTAELCPYMARGEVRHRFLLAGSENAGTVSSDGCCGS